MMRLFENIDEGAPVRESLSEGVAVLRGFALPVEVPLMAAVDSVAAKSPFRHMVTPGGFRMSVAMTNCGLLGWVSDRAGYRYDIIDPETKTPWPEMPAPFLALARRAAEQAGFPCFAPDACLINRYEPGAKLSLHQDRNERDYTQPIVSVSLGLPATFLFGGNKRSAKIVRIPLENGDVVVWGGPARLAYHGIMPLKPGAAGDYRLNLTFRKAG